MTEMHFPEISVINGRLGQHLEGRRDLMRFLCAQGRQSLGCGTLKNESNAAEEASCKLFSSCPFLDKPNLIPCGQGGNNNFWKIIRLCLRSQSKREQEDLFFF